MPRYNTSDNNKRIEASREKIKALKRSFEVIERVFSSDDPEALDKALYAATIKELPRKAGALYELCKDVRLSKLD